MLIATLLKYKNSRVIKALWGGGSGSWILETTLILKDNVTFKHLSTKPYISWYTLICKVNINHSFATEIIIVHLPIYIFDTDIQYTCVWYIVNLSAYFLYVRYCKLIYCSSYLLHSVRIGNICFLINFSIFYPC